ncbi:bifunctional UDP-3-O-[3-hydroxymyristoyl] N-acetylglucosamine deacetylase/3-hydroxyacyl-ACP dehydratase [uncultured Sunxiuqinia sp.]|uniref:bifunctional UDP-3-O-[3-hydroxymyristoyl] N-acetylglucosamine deacetylase/3-hydroxyacyl-ACP dehydratase n=1 Tax=uncultured Sunxiuqinia sp. TaxID=1573825 RepID=UPI002AA7EC14|nr:bifunctional UDP-3-O-[3-hydroxymyristoyl] N-acetylglucosamine deacetylase/3-hydroxyacyl-ACP dehydratase [uncultured Sunxiuqinia sp.]
MTIKQNTLAREFSLSGKGLHTGVQVNMTFKPAPENHGIKFQRVDLENQPTLEADANLVIDTSRGTVIGKGDARLSTIEHAMAALTGMDLDNVLIEIDNEEVPILDGSSKPFVEAIEKTGVEEQNAEREYFEIAEKIVYRDAETGAEIIALPDSEYNLNVMISFNSSVLNNQFAVLEKMSDFKSEIAACRTFVFVRELEFLLQNNLVKGGDLDNAIVIMDKDISQEELNRLADLFNHEHVEVKKEQGILNNLDLQFENECARHKLLDIVGDLSLAGRRIKGRIIATKPGHKVNTEFAKLLKKEIRKFDTEKEIPRYDCSQKPLMSVNDIKTFLPHRFPFLLVDKIVEIKDNYIVGVKNVTANEPFFQGHFPDEPIMPGVLLIEAMAQCGGLYVLHDKKEKYSTYFIRVDNVKFRQKVVPGDTLLFKVELVSPIRRGIANMKGTTYIGNKIVAEGDFMAQIVKA